MNLIGLDFESSGSDPWGKHVPIQIGMAMVVEDMSSPSGMRYPQFKSLIGGWRWESNHNDPSAEWWEWEAEAADVHKIPREALYEALPVWAVDIQAAAWLLGEVGHTGRMWNVIVGWNVAGFDRQFVTRWMPNLNRLLSYRTLDLNALVLALAETDGAYKQIKNEAKQYANRESGMTYRDRHDALVDAKCALYELAYLKGLAS